MSVDLEYGNQAKWDLIFFSTMILIVTVLASNALVSPSWGHLGDVFFGLGYTFMPFFFFFLASIFGVRKKKCVSVNEYALEATDYSKDLYEFNDVYNDSELQLTSFGTRGGISCLWTIMMIVFSTAAFMFLYLAQFGSIISLLLIMSGVTALAGMIGYVLAYHMVSISGNPNWNPLMTGINQLVKRYDVLCGIHRCELVQSVRVEYKVARGQEVAIITGVRPVLTTTTEPPLDIEITVDNMQRIGPEFTYYSRDLSFERRSEVIQSRDAGVLVNYGQTPSESGFIRVRYDNVLRLRMALVSANETCKLVGSLLDILQGHMELSVVPKKKVADEELITTDGSDFIE
jgi:hypothetical protein